MNKSSSILISSLLFVILILVGGQVHALPILPGNEHPHNDGNCIWPGPDCDPTKNHQHWNALPLGVNNGETKWFANKAWDNIGTTTTFHAGGEFGHGFIRNRVDYVFSKTDTAPKQSFIDRVIEAFSQWVDKAKTYFTANKPADRNLELGFNFQKADAAPVGEKFITVRFYDFDTDPDPDIHCVGTSCTTGYFDSSNQNLAFNTNSNITWYTDAAMPAATDGQDFLTTALHEIGHAVGLGHTADKAKVPGSPIMWAFAADPGKRVAIDNGALEGVMALYTQPVPEPSTILLLLVGFGVLLAFRAPSRHVV